MSERDNLFKANYSERLSDVEKSAFSVENRQKLGCVVRGWERPIDVLVEPRVVGDKKHQAILSAAAYADQLLNRAAAYTLAKPDKRQSFLAPISQSIRRVIDARFAPYWDTSEAADQIFTQLEKTNYFGRMDLLVGHLNTTNGLGVASIELNRDCPQGIWYYTAAGYINQSAYRIEATRIPNLSAQLYKTLIGDSEDEAKVAVVSDPDDIINPVELPRATELLNMYSERAGSGAKFIYGDTTQLQVKNASVQLAGESVNTIWRNWGDDMTPDLEEAVINRRIRMINPPEVIVAAQKCLYATLTGDPEFRARLGDKDRQFIDSFFPETHALVTAADVDRFTNDHNVIDYFFKPSDGSSGDGAFRGEELDGEKYREMATKVEAGVIYLAQRQVEPKIPTVPTIFWEDERLVKKDMLADFNPYMFNRNGKRETGPVIVRAKETHPINVAKGGGFTIGLPESAMPK